MTTDAAAGPRDTGLLTHRVDGQGAPLLLLNGGMMTMSSWDAIAAELAPRHTVIRCDFRGQLLSPGEPPPNLAGHVADLLRLLDHLAVERVNVAATSFGAEVGLLLAALEPSRVASLVAATAVDVAPPAMQALGAALVAASRSARSEGLRSDFFTTMAEIIYSPAYLAANRAALTGRHAQFEALPQGWFAGVEALLGAIAAMDLRPILGQIRCPVVVVIAGEDGLMPRERSESLAAAIAGAESLIVPGSGHALVVEQPGEFVRVVASFLARHHGGSRAATSASVNEGRRP